MRHCRMPRTARFAIGEPGVGLAVSGTQAGVACQAGGTRA